MAKYDNRHPPAPAAAANDNPAPPLDQAQLDESVTQVARLNRRQILREAFQGRGAANDNGWRRR